MISTEFKKAAKELSDVAFDYAGHLSITEYRYPDEELIFIGIANPKEGEKSDLEHFRVEYDKSGAKKLREVTRRLSNIAAVVGKETEPILAYFTYKTDVDKELKKAVADLIDISFDYLDLLSVSVCRKANSVDIFIKKRYIKAKDRTLIYKEIRYDEADSAIIVRDIINEIPKLAAEVSAETEYPRLEIATPRNEPKEFERPSFFSKKAKKVAQV